MPAAYYLAPVYGLNQQFCDSNGVILSGGLLYTFLSSTTTPADTYQDPLGLVKNANPIVLTSAGRLPAPIWLPGGTAFTFSLFKVTSQLGPSENGVVGLNYITSSLSAWQVASQAATYISPTSFSVVGDATSLFTVNRAVQSSCTAGVVYSTVASATYSGGITTVTLSNRVGQLDAGLSTVLVSFSDSSGAPVAASPTLIGPSSAIVGTTTNDYAASGRLGEYLYGTGTNSAGSTPSEVCTITLTAGDWDLHGSVILSITGTTGSGQYYGGISTASDSLPTSPFLMMNTPYSVSGTPSISPPPVNARFSVSGSTTLYLVCSAQGFGSNTVYAAGVLWARRRR